MAKKIVIIGGGAAGIDVLELLLRREADSEEIDIILLKKEYDGFFSMCGLPFALQGICDIKELSIFEPYFYINQGIDFRTSTEVKGINLEDKSISLDSGEIISYDQLVIATGSRPFIPQIDGIDLEGVYTLSNRDDGERILAALNSPKTKSALIVGGGWIGLQSAIAFSNRGIMTKVVEKLPFLLPSLLDVDMSAIVEKNLREKITFVLGKSVSAIKGCGYVESVLIGEDEHPADTVLLSAGMRPSVELARDAGLEIGESGGIVTDRAMRAKVGKNHLDNVYALGDCAEVIDAVTYRPRLSQLASTALIQARVVANNLLGIGSSCELCLSPTVASISGLQIGSVGVTSETAKRYGIPIKVGIAGKYTKARFFPGRMAIYAKLIFDAYCDRLIGAQIISGETVAERINELALGIRAGITAREIWMRERCFDPSLAMVEDVIVDAAIKAG